MLIYREEAISYKKNRIRGEIAIKTNNTYAMLLTIIISLASAIIIFISIAEFSKSETAYGIVLSRKSQSRIVPEYAGYISEVYVKNGDSVVRGQRLFKVRRDKSTVSGKSLKDDKITDYERQIANNNTRKKSLKETNKVTIEKLERQRVHAISRKNLLLEKIETSGKRLSLQKNEMDIRASLSKTGLIPRKDFDASMLEYLKIRENNITYNSDIADVDNEIKNISYSIKEVELDTKLKILEIDNQIISLSREVAILNNEIEYFVEARSNGNISNFSKSVGDDVNSQDPIMVVEPLETELYGEIYLESKSIGFVKKNDNVKIKVDAYPYQTYGIFDAKIYSISNSILMPSEWDNYLSVKTPIYKVYIDVKEVNAKKNIKLKPGMKFQAEIVLEKVTILNYLTEPIRKLSEI